MADGSTIEWLQKPGYKGATWNPTRGCSRQGAGCEHCWAIGQARRQDTPGGAYEGLTTIRNGRVDWLGTSRPAPEMLSLPLRWRDPRCVFVESMGDLWHPGIPFEYVAAVFGVMAACPQHDFIILTKQARRMRAWFSWTSEHYDGLHTIDRFFDENTRKLLATRWLALGLANGPWPLPNVSLLVSAWDQASANTYIPDLLACPAAIRGVSAEPLLGPIRFADVPGFNKSGSAGQDLLRNFWVICGGESGNGSRPMQPEWATSLRDQCAAVGVAFHFKQWGNWAPTAGGLVRLRTKKAGGRLLDGREWNEFPKAQP